MARYSLARYTLTVKLPDDFDQDYVAAFGSTLSIGGQGSMTGSINIDVPQNLWETEGDVTGGYTHNQNLDRHGTCTVVLKQVADAVVKFIRLCNCFYKAELDSKEGLYLQVNDNDNNVIAICEDSYIQKIPTQAFGATAAEQDWVFTCGKITFAAPQI